MIAVRFFGPFNSSSGYGNAVKNFATAFSKSGIPTKFAFSSKILERNHKFFDKLNSHSGSTNVDFYLHPPPWSKHKSRAKYKIGYFYWEADTLPNHWKKHLGFVDEIWAPCDLVKRACIKAGFKGPIKVVPTPSRDIKKHRDLFIESPLSSDYCVSDSVYKFYSIFQWHERKGFKELISSYINEFSSDEQVLLVLKVNELKIPGYNGNSIYKDIKNIKRRINKPNAPRIFLSRGLLSTSIIDSIHYYCDCYVAPFHGEGWGMPIHDAIFAKNLLITTQYGGISEWLSNDDAFIIKHKLGPVKNMGWSPLYGAHQNWAYPNQAHLRRLMRSVFEDHESMSDRTEKLGKIAVSMDIDHVAKIINREISNLDIK